MTVRAAEGDYTSRDAPGQCPSQGPINLLLSVLFLTPLTSAVTVSDEQQEEEEPADAQQLHCPSHLHPPLLLS